jgi:hypothetical protein
MDEFPRKSDGRRVFTVEFKRGVVRQLLKGDKTLAEVSRELDIQPSVVRQWKRRFEAGGTAAVVRRLDDETLVQQIRAVTNSRATYGYRRVWAMVNRTFRAGYNRKRIRRLIRMHDLMLPPRCIAATDGLIWVRCSSRRRTNAGARTGPASVAGAPHARAEAPGAPIAGCMSL